MYSEFGLELAQAQRNVLALHGIDAKIESLSKEKTSLEINLEDLRTQLDKENADVDRLAKTSLAQLFYSALGRLDEKISEEQREALAFSLKYDQAVRDLEGVNKELAELHSARIIYQDSEKAYADLYDKKKEVLLQSGSPASQQIISLTERMQFAVNNSKEIRDALSAGFEAQESLNAVMVNLDKAKSWGTWDLLGGGLICDLAKHSDIDDARAEAMLSQELLRRFRTELADVRMEKDIKIDIGSFAKFADFFFDGLLADWCMQTQIDTSRANVEQVERQVEDVITRLRVLEDNQTANILQLETDLENLVLNT